MEDDLFDAENNRVCKTVASQLKQGFVAYLYHSSAWSLDFIPRDWNYTKVHINPYLANVENMVSS
jgi:hypothetical protein